MRLPRHHHRDIHKPEVAPTGTGTATTDTENALVLITGLSDLRSAAVLYVRTCVLWNVLSRAESSRLLSSNKDASLIASIDLSNEAQSTQMVNENVMTHCIIILCQNNWRSLAG